MTSAYALMHAPDARQKLHPGSNAKNPPGDKLLRDLLAYWTGNLQRTIESQNNTILDEQDALPLTAFVHACFGVAGVKDRHQRPLSLDAIRKRIQRANTKRSRGQDL